MPLWAWGAGGALVGLIVGSFLATLVLRWPRGEAVTSGRSRCDRCGAQVTARDLVPLLSGLLLGWQCRSCGARIDPAHVAIEGVCGLVGGAAFLVAPGQAGFLGALSGWLLVALAALDLRHFWLPDRLTLSLALVGLAGGLTGVAPALEARLIGGTAGFLSLAAIAWGYRQFRKRDGLGGGDPKLFGAIGLMLGWQALPYVLLGASGVGLIYIAMLFASGRRPEATDRLPLGALMALSGFAVWLAQQ